MSSCFIWRVLAFGLAFLCGVAAWQLVGVKLLVVKDVHHLEYGRRVLPGERGGTWAAARPEGEQSRTWLVIRSNGPSLRGVSRPVCDGCSVKMRVLFGVDGVAVPGNGFSLSPSSYPLIEEATAAARAIEFTPATKDGRPVPVWAYVTYDCGGAEFKPRPYRGLCALTVDRTSARTWDGRPWRVAVPYE